MKKSIVFWQFIGFSFVCISGTLLHFLFDWSSENIVVGIFSAVNESIWEHIKLLYFPMLIFTFIESKRFNSRYKNFWCAKAIGFLVGTIFIPTIYYTYTGALGVKADWFNILIFFITAALLFFTETKIIKNNRECHISPIVSKIFILLLGVLFVIFTFAPPRIPLFQDPLDSSYGFFKTI